MGYFQDRYDPKVIFYDRKAFIRLITASLKLPNLGADPVVRPDLIKNFSA